MAIPKPFNLDRWLMAGEIKFAWVFGTTWVAAMMASDALGARMREMTVNNPNHYPFADFQKRVSQAVVDAPVLADRGIIVFSAGVGLPKPPREVLHQRVRAWRTRWQLASFTRMAAVNNIAFGTQNAEGVLRISLAR